MNSFKGIDLVEKVTEELWMEVCNCTGGSDQTHPRENKSKKTKWLFEEALQIAERREEKEKGKGKHIPNGMQSCENSKER